ncbi:M14 family metallopeptidase [Aestuariibacter sp. AA17]|uniref:M14 family metallopeptidase n=1 Tax=Fluctibacter corallii TaxID=2984329 RepID=A0ABT3AB60_9ALTE|nr:M14 metallopeptidase family protein [Aestuariibacter sp. AA17]MCV2885830.1 M14 family metallopeptidase [Aestuariibacter sp. AA17]
MRFMTLMACALVWVSGVALAKTDLDYLPSDVKYDASIPKPADILGAPVGEWHVRHDQLVTYMRTLAEKSDRVSLVETGRTHENRPLLLLAFTSSENQQNLDALREKHVAVVRSGKTPDASSPLVLWMGYSVHGDEASGSNAALLIAYYLAAAQGEKVNQLLKDNVVLLDPALNPDGLSRFAQWVNMHKGATLVSDREHREHVQAWPSGRTNHYWFDLNRDWLLLVHPESRARIKEFQRWRPHVLTDFHEMGADSTYFFQPGIASRKNPWTPEENVTLTNALGEYHAKALDAAKQLYFTQESFDDFYYGKGSTYPDAQGTIGILFEQGSARGHLHETINGDRSFPEAIQNQVTTTLSTFDGALANKDKLIAHQHTFNQETNNLIKDDELTGYMIRESHDKSKIKQLLDVLSKHEIEVKSLQKDVTLDNIKFAHDSSYFVPLDQPKYRLIKSIFSERKRFKDNTFYDVSNWNLALAYNLDFYPVDKKLWRNIPTETLNVAQSSKQEKVLESAYAYAFSWQDSQAPAMLQTLIKNGVNPRIAGQSFAAKTSQGEISFAQGSILIPRAVMQPDNLAAILNEASRQHGIKIWSLISGLTAQGIDLGSRFMLPLEMKRVLIVGGEQTSQYEVGEAWHYLDKIIGMPVSIVELSRLDSIDMRRYSHMIWVNGRYGDVDEELSKEIERWVKQGGVLIGQKAGAKLFAEKGWLKAEFAERSLLQDAFKTDDLQFGDREALHGKQRVAGAVFNTHLDISHPLAFGYTRDTLPVFRNHTHVMKQPAKPFLMVAQYTDTPLRAGYAADEVEDVIANSAAIVAHANGYGRVIAFADNPVFRGYWLGTRRLLSNAIYMAPFIDVDG